MGVTIREVARRAGVSVATVSRVLNHSGPVRDETRRRVEEVARALRYAPNVTARSLSTRRTHTLAAILPDLYGEFFSEVIRGLDQTAQAGGYNLLISSSHRDRRGVEAALRALRGRVDGLILMAPDIDAGTLLSDLPESLPVVLVNSPVVGTGFDSINIDNYGGAYAMTRHLTERGHRRIAFIKGAAGNYDAGERLRGYRDALRDAGCAANPAFEVAGDFTDVSGYRAMGEILGLEPRPTAAFAANDAMAIGALGALRESGVAVPEEFAVAGFDDIPIARYVNPPLSSVRVDIPGLGARAVRVLLDAIEKKNAHRRSQEILPTALVPRDTTGPAKAVEPETPHRERTSPPYPSPPTGAKR